MGCITQDYKDILKGLFKNDAKPEIISALVEALPVCETPGGPRATAGAVEEAKKRRQPTQWANPKTGDIIKPVYFDEKGGKTEFGSISALVADRGLPMSGLQCDAEGKSCKATSAVEILQIAGYVVRDDGGEVVKGVSEQVHVYHPKAPQLKKIHEKA